MWVEQRSSPTLTFISGDEFPPFAAKPGDLCERTDRNGKLYTWDQEDGWIDASTDTRVSVKAFKAKGDGINDDTEAIQAAIDYCISKGNPATVTRKGLRPLYLPTGIYRITAPLRIWSVLNFRMYGDGDGSWIAPGADMATGLDLNGVAYSSFENFIVAGNPSTVVVTSVIKSYWDNTTAIRSNTQNTFKFVRVGGKYVNGWEIGSNGSNLQVDNHSFFHCYASGAWETGELTYWENGFLVGSGVFANNLIHSFYKITSINNRNGVKVNATQVAIYGGDLEDNEVDLYVTSTSYFYAGQIRSEESRRLLVTSGSVTVASLMTLSDIDWKAGGINADGYWIIYHNGGALNLNNIRCYSDTMTTARVVVEAANATVVANGLAVGGTLFSPTLAGAFRLDTASSGVVANGFSSLTTGAVISSHTRGPVVLGGALTTNASTTASAGLRLPAGTAPTSPVDGDIWTTTAGLFVRINGATVGPLS